MNDSVILVTLLGLSTKNLLIAIKDHAESEADSSSTSMAVEDGPTGSHDDESKPISKRHRLLQKQSTVLTFQLKKQFVQK